MDQELTKGERQTLLSAARLTLQAYVKTGRFPDIALTSPGLTGRTGALVALTALGQQRGSAVSLDDDTPLYLQIGALTSTAADDSRYRRIEAEELHQVRIRILLLRDLQPVTDTDKMLPRGRVLYIDGGGGERNRRPGADSPDAVPIEVAASGERIDPVPYDSSCGESPTVIIPAGDTAAAMSSLELLEQACEDAGLPRDAYRSGARVLSAAVEEIMELDL